MAGEARGGDGPVPLDALADLQAGLLDDATAAQLRRRARTEPEVARRLAALDRVRRSVADLGADAASAPDIPAQVTARIGAALRAQPPAGSTAPRRVSSPRPRRVAAAIGVAAILAAVAVGTVALIRDASRDQFADGVPLSDAQIVDLLSQPPDLGTLADPQRRVSCLSGLGYPTSTSVLGARRVDVDGTPEVLILLPGDTPGRLNAVVVGPNCSSLDTGLRAIRVVDHP